MGKNYKKLLLILVLVSFGLIIPTSIARAFVVTTAIAVSALSSLLLSMAKAAIGLAKEFGIIVGKFALVLLISSLFLHFANGFLSWAADPNIISGALQDNQVVMAGWGVVRDFVNMFFILILVAIGIGTALRIKGYEINKILPRLILIAILINFTPIIAGVIIDASDILMNFFLHAGAEGFNSILNLSGTSVSNLMSVLWSAVRSPTEIFNGTLAFRTIALTIFNFIAGFVLFLLALLLIVRHVVIWILVILSPLAFFSYILPKTQKLWNMWWQQFIKWSFIGVGASFFLYLTQITSQAIDGGRMVSAPSAEGLALDSNTIFILVQSIPIIFLMIGMFVISSTSAMGASSVINLAKKGSGWAKKKGKSVAINQLKKGVRRTGERAYEGMDDDMRKKMDQWASANTPGGVKGAALAPLYWLKRKTGQTLGPKSEQKIASIIGDLEKEAEKMSVNVILAKFREAKTQTEKLAYLNTLAKKNKLDDAMDAGLSETEMAPVFGYAKKQHLEKDLFAAAPQMAHAHMPNAAAFQDMVKNIRPNRAKYLSENALTHQPTMNALLRSWDGSQFGSLISERGTSVIPIIETQIRQEAQNAGLPVRAWLRRENPRLLQYITSNAGRRDWTIL
ncbi:MAG: hypothetical protein KKB21_00720 [Nanoarchaeota archaeon]|nr:hypothetical protein [Nanoarchaeota archaeon]